MFVITANCNFVPGGYDDWQAAYNTLADYVWENEPTTMTYYFGLPLQYWTNKSATTHMFAFEMYINRDALYTTHFNSPVMAEFLTKIPPLMTTGLDLSHYEDTGGFLDRFGDKRECEIMVDVRMNVKPEARNSLLCSLGEVSKAIEDSEAVGTYTFLVLKNLDTDGGVRIFQRFESWRAQSQLASSKPMLGFWQGAKDEIVSMESQTYVPNGNKRSWLHRGGLEVRNGH